MTDLATIAARFAIPAPIGSIQPLGRGLINDTFLIESGGSQYVLQRINGAVFSDPSRIMANLRTLQSHLIDRKPQALRLPSLIPTSEGDNYLIDDASGSWRLQEYIPDAVTLERIADPFQAREVGAMLGRFHQSTASLPTDRLSISLPGFHDTPGYFGRLVQSYASVRISDPAIDDCLDFVVSRSTLASLLEQAHGAGDIPSRVTHGDPKLDNILFHGVTGHAIALIDLDTVQPGLLLHDLGDCLRSCCNRSGENTDDSITPRFDLDICDGILSGYASTTADLLRPAEIALMYEGIRLLPFELGMRFLTDHLDGDRYFRVEAHGQNLHRARVQFALVADIERQAEQIEQLILTHFAG